MEYFYTQIYIHYIWSTRSRVKILTPEIVAAVNRHIREHAPENDIFVVEVNGYQDHYHLLVELPPTLSVARAINLVKGESSHWINEQNFFRRKFFWQKKYAGVSVSPSQKERVAEFIRKQAEFHRNKSFREEIEELFKKCGLKIPKDFFN
ncbi:MAG: IS200/IS605 family transposase [Calditrichaeota bacterium]|nr:IS200/IS605 family transposase [Calditrichota bacterium]